MATSRRAIGNTINDIEQNIMGIGGSSMKPINNCDLNVVASSRCVIWGHARIIADGRCIVDGALDGKNGRNGIEIVQVPTCRSIQI